MDKQNKIARFIGQAAGVIVIGCVAACLCALMVALSVKFIAWIF